MHWINLNHHGTGYSWKKNEIAQIEQYYKSGKAEFIAVYGRRRVGNTFLIRQYFKNRFAFDMTGVMEGSKAEQMTAFHTALKTYGYKGAKINMDDLFQA